MRGRKKRGGFTLAEVLVTVAIIGILLAIAIPSAVAIRKDLKLLELDNAARDVFIAAQNRLTALRASDGLEAANSRQPAQTDPDAPAGVGPLVYVDNTDGIFDTLLPARSIDRTLLDGGAKAVIEYDPESGSVYAVFYSENEFDYDASTPRGRDGRRANDPMIGYYGGDAAQTPGADILQKPDFRIENGEELKLVADYSEVLAGDPGYAETMPDLAYTVTLTQADAEGNTVKLEKPTLAPGAEEHVYELVLDSLTGPHFADIAYRDAAIAIDPGADVIVSVRIEYTGDTPAKPVTWSGRTNSLFAARGPSGEGTAEKDDVVQVSCGRHLQNLEPRVSGLGMGPTDRNTAEKDKYQPAYVVQEGKIDWTAHRNDTVTAYGGGGVGAGGATEEPEKFGPAGSFLSIANESVRSFDGAGSTIEGLRIVQNTAAPVMGKNSRGVGLFAMLDHAAVSGVRLVNPRLDGGDKGTALGMLAGYAADSTLADCCVYLDGDGVKALKNDPEAYGVFAGSEAWSVSAGGLAGWVKDGAVQNCFAALPAVRANAYSSAAGLLGTLESSEGTARVSKCYAAVTVLNGFSASGFVSQITGYSGVEITNCYAAGALYADSAAGFIGSAAGGVRVNNCYAAASYDGGFGTGDTPFGPKDGASYTACNYVTGIVDGPPTVSAADGAGRLSAIYYRDLKNKTAYGGSEGGAPIWSGNLESTTHGYTMKPYAQLSAQLQNKVDGKLYSDKVYPFPRLAASEHYGNWPLPAQNGAFVYYEVYEGGQEIGMTGYRLDGTAFAPETPHPLREGQLVVRDGYAYVDGTDTVTLSVGGTGSVSVKKDMELSGMAGVVVCPVPYEILKGAALCAGSSFYGTLTVDGSRTKLHFNPHFAKTVVYAEGEPEAGTAAVRSARQLAALGAYPQYWTRSFAQQAEIDFSRYDTDYTGTALVMSPIGSGNNAVFTGVYDGGRHSISGVEITGAAGQPTGLFGRSKGTLQNIVLRGGGTRTIRGEGDVAVGALAGIVLPPGRVINCASDGFIVKGFTAGGLVGSCTNATIQNCAAAQVLVEGEQNGEMSGISGGLVGSMMNGSVTDCYALGALQAAGPVAGIAAQMLGRATVQNSYSACTVTEASGTVYGVVHPVENAPVKVENCAYLEQEIAAEVSPVNGVQALDYEGLKTALSGAFGSVTEANTHPYGSKGAYPFPSSVKNAANEPVHYGDWPEEKEKPAEFGEFEIGVAIKNADNKSFEIWGVDENNAWSDEPIDTVALNNPEYDMHVFICIPKQAQGQTKHKWYIWNASIGNGKPVLLSDFKSYKLQGSAGYEFYYESESWNWDRENWFYDHEITADESGGKPPTGWSFRIKNPASAGGTPVFKGNS